MNLPRVQGTPSIHSCSQCDSIQNSPSNPDELVLPVQYQPRNAHSVHTMNFLDLPFELRLQIYELLPDLQPGHHETIGHNVRLTPAISRASRLLRRETLPVYARNAHFIIALSAHDHLSLQPPSQQASHPPDPTSRMGAWLAALAARDHALAHVGSLQLSRDWALPHPSRWQGHVGFYLRLQRRSERVLRRSGWGLMGGEGSGEAEGHVPTTTSSPWRGVVAGTYPIANDGRGLRAESVEVLRAKVERRVMEDGGDGLTVELVGLVVRAMDVVATHPVSAFDMEQSEAARRRRREIWMEMETELTRLTDSGLEGPCDGEWRGAER